VRRQKPVEIRWLDPIGEVAGEFVGVYVVERHDSTLSRHRTDTVEEQPSRKDGHSPACAILR